MRGWWHTLETWEKALILVWVVVFSAISLRMLLAPPRRSNIYPVFVTSARNWLCGTHVYRMPDSSNDVEDFRYSPVVLELFVPFAQLPDRAGNILWRLLNLGVFFAGLRHWCGHVLPAFLGRGHMALIALLTTPWLLGNINNGQSNPLMLGLMLLGTSWVLGRRWTLAAACLAAACLFKIYPLALAMLLMALYPRPLLGRMLLFLAVGLALPYVMQEPAYVSEQYGRWFRYLALEDRESNVEGSYRDVRFLWRVAFGPMPYRLHMVLQMLTAGASLGLCLAARRRRWSERRLVTFLFGLACVWMTVFGVATESPTYLLLAPTLAWTLVRGRRERCSTAMQLWSWASFAMFVAAGMARWFPAGTRLVQAAPVEPVAGLFLLIAICLGEWFSVEKLEDKQTPILRQAA